MELPKYFKFRFSYKDNGVWTMECGYYAYNFKDALLKLRDEYDVVEWESI